MGCNFECDTIGGVTEGVGTLNFLCFVQNKASTHFFESVKVILLSQRDGVY
jgi:hypothetical protein